MASCCKVLHRVVYALLALAVVFGAFVGITWIVYRPHKLTAAIDSVSLTELRLSPANSSPPRQLLYDIGVNVKLTNPNKKFHVYLDIAELDMFYGGSLLVGKSLTPTELAPNSTKRLQIAIRGSRVAERKLPQMFARETLQGYYNVNLKFETRLTLKVLELKVHRKLMIDCDVKIPVNGGKLQPQALQQNRNCSVKSL